jgi:hypothetical protein
MKIASLDDNGNSEFYEKTRQSKNDDVLFLAAAIAAIALFNAFGF